METSLGLVDALGIPREVDVCLVESRTTSLTSTSIREPESPPNSRTPGTQAPGCITQISYFHAPGSSQGRMELTCGKPLGLECYGIVVIALVMGQGSDCYAPSKPSDEPLRKGETRRTNLPPSVLSSLYYCFPHLHEMHVSIFNW